MKNINKFLIIIGTMIVIAIITIVYKVTLNNRGKLNEGNYRVNDFVVRSMVSVEDEVVENTENLSDIKIKLSQNNLISILISKNTENTDINKIYIDNIKTSKPNKLGTFVIYQESSEQKYNLSNNETKKIDIIPKEVGLQYQIDINIDNVNFVENINIPEGINELKYDGTILNNIGIAYRDIEFKIEFDLNIIEKSGRLNKCSVELEIPDETLFKNGIVINRLSLSNFSFEVK